MKPNLHPTTPLPLPALVLLWAGLSLGGNIIAAPAKFQVDTLTIPDLLQVGRAQFAWLGIAEMALAAAFLTTCLLTRRWPGLPALAAIAIFATQQFGLQPMLEARTNLILTGQPAPPSLLHLAFIATELTKFALLTWAGLALMRPRQTSAGGVSGACSGSVQHDA